MLAEATTTILERDPEAVRQEIFKRNMARRHLVDFSRYVAPYYVPGRHHELVGRYLEQVKLYIETKGEQGIGRLLIFEPPRHGKSEQSSRHFPAWLLGNLPDLRIIMTSYGLKRAAKFSRDARNIMLSELYRPIFGDLGAGEVVEISRDSKSVEAWDLAAPHRGGMVAAGIGGPITGFGADLFIVDDPIKNRQEAENPKLREDIWEWWQSTAYTRLEKGGAIIGQLTRWHRDDWAGRLLKRMAEDSRSDQYVVISLPAIWEEPEVPEGLSFEEHRLNSLKDGIWLDEHDLLGRKTGKALWPAKYDEEDLERIQANTNPYEWGAQYQQRPYLKSGNLFDRKDFIIIERIPKDTKIIKRVRYWDKAATAGGGAFTSGVLGAWGDDGILYVEDRVRGQWAAPEREATMIRIGKADLQRQGSRTVIWHEREPAGSGLDSAQATNANLANAGLTARFDLVTGSKEDRADPWGTFLAAGRVRIVRGTWNDDYIATHVAFPGGTYKDDVDASSGMYSKLRKRGSGINV